MKTTKKRDYILKNIKINKIHGLRHALNIIKSCSSNNFNKGLEKIDININLYNNKMNKKIPIKLPYTLIIKSKIIAIINNKDEINKLRSIGITSISSNELINNLKKYINKFKFLICDTNNFKDIIKIRKTLCSKNLWPNLQDGTLSSNIINSVEKIQNYSIMKINSNGCVSCTIGDITFDYIKLYRNIHYIIKYINNIDPQSNNNLYYKKIVLSSTTGPGIKINLK